jgi:hypothetical protein
LTFDLSGGIVQPGASQAWPFHRHGAKPSGLAFLLPS